MITKKAEKFIEKEASFLGNVGRALSGLFRGGSQQSRNFFPQRLSPGAHVPSTGMRGAQRNISISASPTAAQQGASPGGIGWGSALKWGTGIGAGSFLGGTMVGAGGSRAAQPPQAKPMGQPMQMMQHQPQHFR